jgi:protein SCO1/2
MPLKKLVTVLSLLLALVAGVIAYLAVTVAPEPAEPQTAMLFPYSRELPQFELLDHDGKQVGRDVFEGHWNLVFFGFTHCPDVCPTTLQILSDAKRQMRERNLDLPRIVLVSVDPERDTPALLGQYIRYFGDDNLGLTGELGELRKLTTALGIYFEKGAVSDNGYNVDHSAVVILIDPDGRQRGLFSSPHVAGNFVADLALIMATQ